MTMKMQNKVLIGGLAITMALIVFWGHTSTMRPVEARTVTVGYIPIADTAQLYVAIEKGFFKEKSIEVKLVSLPGGAKILEAMGAGSVDVGFSNVVSLILIRSSGLDFVAFAGGPTEDENHKEHAIMVAKNSSISSPKDLEGKTIAINTFKNIDEAFVKEYLVMNGIDLNKVNFITIPFPQMEAALLSGQIQAAATIEPFVTAALQNGKSRVLTYNYIEVQPVTEISTYVARKEWIEKNSLLAKDFADALNKAADYANGHPDETKEIVSKYAKIDPQLAKAMALPVFSRELSIERLDSMKSMLIRRGILNKDIDIKGMVYRP